MSKFDKAFEIVVGAEGGYSDHPSDPGGKTMYGITERVARSFGYTGEMRELPLEKAKEIYEKGYWGPAGCAQLPWPMCLYVFDSAVNQGVDPAKRMLQEALKVTVDGAIGPRTIMAAENQGIEGANTYLAVRACRYVLTKNWATFGKGWMKRLFEVAVKGKEYGG